MGAQRIIDWAGEASSALVPLGMSPIQVAEPPASIADALPVLDSASERLRRLDQILIGHPEDEVQRPEVVHPVRREVGGQLAVGLALAPLVLAHRARAAAAAAGHARRPSPLQMEGREGAREMRAYASTCIYGTTRAKGIYMYECKKVR